MADTPTWLTVSEASKRTGIPDRTLRRYIERHTSFIVIRRQGRNYLVATDSLPALQLARSRYVAGESADQVEEALSERFSRTLTVAESGQDMAITPMEALGRMTDELTTLRQQVEALKDAVEEGDKDRKRREEERDRKLEEALNRLEHDQRPWWRFWDR